MRETHLCEITMCNFSPITYPVYPTGPVVTGPLPVLPPFFAPPVFGFRLDPRLQ